MNKDLDDRLIPNGEYRDARNISVGKSEDEDIGALETVLGNVLVNNTTLGITGLKVIGSHTDKGNNRMFVFLTDSISNHFIYQLTEPDNYVQLVTGAFLNFSQSNLITGISLIENLLFFTDNRNQPRKINVEKAAENSDYYNDESQISVAKYNPYEPINLLKKIEAIAGTGSAGINIVLATANTAIVPGMSLISTNSTNNPLITPTEYLYVTAVNGTAITLCTACSPLTDPVDGDKLYFITTTMTGQDISPYFDGVAMPAATTWPGDPDYLESRFVRFSYRFQYDDGEYSIMAPFTQIAYIPKQKGYFLAGDEDEAYKSTILQWMENGVQNVELSILLPDNISNLQTLSSSSYKIISIDVLYKESDSRAVKVLDRVPLGTVANTTVENVYTYKYQSTKPFRTLPENQTVRVFDKVPVLAQAQETAGNRIIYGNFKDKYTPPNTVSYKVAVAPKILTTKYDNWVEYPNHSIKQNRNYQVGFVLADKFGRQSSVILADVEGETTVLDGVAYGGSTVYSPYNNSAESATNPVKDWFGDALRVIVESPINETVNTDTGTPGLYANARGTGFDVAGNTVAVSTTSPFIYTFTPVAITNIPQLGDYLRGEYKDFVKVSITPTVDGAGEYTVTCDGAINKDIYELTGDAGAQVKYAYTLNSKGWYSYKVVVKQNEQEYYNVYLPGIVKGYPFQDPAATNIVTFPVDSNTSNIVLFNDNINKVPRDLTEVGPDQKQYRSSVQLFGRVENTMTAAAPTTDPGVANNHQFFPNTTTNIVPLSDTAISISSATDSNMAFEVFQSYDSNDPILYSTLTLTGQNSLYQLDTNPLIARLSTSQDIGAASLVAADTANPSMTPFLAVYETEPVDSLLDIYWETTTVGLIADLNSDINTSFNGPVGFSSYTWTQPESLPSGSTFLTGIKPVDSNGAVISGTTTLTNFVSTPAGIAPVGVAPFTAAQAVGYSFKTTSDFVYDSNSSTTAVFTLSMNITDNTGTTSGTLQLTGGLANTQPIISGVTAGELPAKNTQDDFTGTVATISGVNGSAFTTSNQQQLQWTITAGNTLGFFAININTGVITQLSQPSATVHNLTIRLTDANTTTGSLFIEANQQITVSSSVVGFPFSAGQADGNIAQVCPLGNPPGSNPIAPTCGQYTYWNTTRNSGTPQVNDIISTTGPTITLAGRGYYSFNCLNGPGSGTSTGTNRLVFKIEQANYPTLDGKVTYVGFCGDPNMP